MGDEVRALTRLLPQVRELVRSARHTAARAVNTLQVVTNFEIGRLIVQHQEHGPQRADYGVALLKQLSMSLTEEFGRGFSRSNPEERAFYELEASSEGWSLRELRRQFDTSLYERLERQTG